MNIDDVEFNRGAVRPMECFREGWQLIKEDYWLFFGITFVGVFIGGMASPFLVGPMMCGIYLCLLHQEQGKKVTFDMVFQGFNYFVPSLIATLIEVVPIIILVIGWYIVIVGGMIAILAANGPNRQGGPPPDGLLLGFFGAYFLGFIFLIVVSVVLKVFFLFTYMLILEKNVTGWESVRLSARAGRANFSGLLALLLLSMALTFVGFMFCGIGAYFEMPLSFAMYTIAYRQIFPHRDPFERFTEEDEDDDDEPADEPSRRLDAGGDTSVKAEPTP